MSAVMAPPISIHKVWLRSAHGTSVQWRIAIRNKTDEIGNGVDIGPASRLERLVSAKTSLLGATTIRYKHSLKRAGLRIQTRMKRWLPSLLDIHRVVELALNC